MVTPWRIGDSLILMRKKLSRCNRVKVKLLGCAITILGLPQVCLCGLWNLLIMIGFIMSGSLLAFFKDVDVIDKVDV